MDIGLNLFIWLYSQAGCGTSSQTGWIVDNITKEGMRLIHVIDSLMGTGKTKWAVNHMNSSDKHFIYVAPFLTECDRIQEECAVKNFRQPDALPTKQDDFKELIHEGFNTVITHELFKQLQLSDDDVENLSKWDYELIIDEVVETLYAIQGLNSADYNILKPCFTIDSKYSVTWDESDTSLYWPARYDDIRKIAKSGNLVCVNKQFFWKLPTKFISYFRDVYIMTYNFEYSHMSYDLKIEEYDYTIFHIEGDSLVEGPQDVSGYKKWFRDNVVIYGGRNNSIGESTHALSATGFKTMSSAKKAELIGKIRSYFAMCKVQSPRCMYARYKTAEEIGTTNNSMPIRSFKKAAFVPFNTTATNAYRDKDVLCYAVNVYEMPNIMSYYRTRGFKFNQEGKALNTMLQWIYRSVIRCHPDDRTEPVRLAVFSSRMRGLLNEWLDS